MKAKSMKLRTLITLHALFKHTDKTHRMNSTKLNEFLKPHGLECSKRVISDTAKVMREFGIDVQLSGSFDKQGFWIEKRPLPDEALHKLIFAVTTNPHITQEQGNEILNALVPLVTVYNEPLLISSVETKPSFPVNEFLFKIYSTIIDAIANKRRVMYTVETIRYDKETNECFSEDQWDVLFTPSRIYQSDKTLYMFGYNHNNHSIRAVPLDKIKDIRPSFKKQAPNREETYAMLDAANPADYIPETKPNVLYKGPVTFRCRGPYVEHLYKAYGPPAEPVEKDKRGKTVYKAAYVEFTTETLYTLENIPGHPVRVIGPEPLVEIIQQHYKKLSKTMTHAVI